MKVLITGGAGFVGSHLASACFDRGDNVTIVDNDTVAQGWTGHDVRDFFLHHDNPDVDLLIHCAAIVGGRRLIDGTPAQLFTHNAWADAAMFDWVLRNRPKVVVYYSSSAAYPSFLQADQYRHALAEHDIELRRQEHPETTYGQAKLHGEQLAAEVRKTGQIVHVLRPFSGYGHDQSLDYPFPSFIKRAVERADPFDIWGTGNQVRDWIHIDDIVRATLAAAELDQSITANLCTGRPTTFTELAHLVTRAAGYTPELRYLDAKPGGVAYRVGDPTQMLTFYEPKVTLEEGIARALAATP